MARNSKGQLSAEDNPKPFTKDNQPENRGRKPKGFRAFAIYCKSKGFEAVTEHEVIEAYLLLMQLPAHEVLAIGGDPLKDSLKKGGELNEHPAILRMVANEFFGKRGQEMLRHLESRAFGAYRTKNEHNITAENPLSSLSAEELAEVLRIVEGKKK